MAMVNEIMESAMGERKRRFRGCEYLRVEERGRSGIALMGYKIYGLAEEAYARMAVKAATLLYFDISTSEFRMGRIVFAT